MMSFLTFLLVMMLTLLLVMMSRRNVPFLLLSAWNLDIETVDFSEEENDDGDNQEVSAGLEILDATTYFMCGELRTIS